MFSWMSTHVLEAFSSPAVYIAIQAVLSLYAKKNKQTKETKKKNL